jgi:hypothetical protein
MQDRQDAPAALSIHVYSGPMQALSNVLALLSWLALLLTTLCTWQHRWLTVAFLVAKACSLLCVQLASQWYLERSLQSGQLSSCCRVRWLCSSSLVCPPGLITRHLNLAQQLDPSCACPCSWLCFSRKRHFEVLCSSSCATWLGCRSCCAPQLSARGPQMSLTYPGITRLTFFYGSCSPNVTFGHQSGQCNLGKVYPCPEDGGSLGCVARVDLDRCILCPCWALRASMVLGNSRCQ